MKQIERIAVIVNSLKEKQLTAKEIKNLFTKPDENISIRQIQRDLKDIKYFLNNDECIKSNKENKSIYYSIIRNKNNIHYSENENTIILDTNFYHQIDTDEIQKNLSNVERAIINKKNIIIHSIKNDETGDNAEFMSEDFSFFPIHIINHRNTYYVGGWNPKKKVVQIFGTNQLEHLEIGNKYFSYQKYKSIFDEEFLKRFGVTKNINKEVYDIKIEMSAVLAGFISSHQWHDSQKFIKKNRNYILHLQCGINRELLGWLYQWMYNIRIIEPSILNIYYQRGLNEMQKNKDSKQSLIYRNIFEEK